MSVPAARPSAFTCITPASYPKIQTSTGGGLAPEGEDIHILSLKVGDALAKVASGEMPMPKRSLACNGCSFTPKPDDNAVACDKFAGYKELSVSTQSARSLDKIS